ncbi:DUF397 domain-containing protein [Streptomyces sp. NBC_00378]|uniref:DUF397 domain-containing protein n=1 Tax=unclassified Streptomyces TaxID=2593676 RepID=UPI0022547E8C|nr:MULTISPECIES: DUF397 domain-containing protein [unclassified Streptomyces]MCX5109187.1 DUF397 domain-containing protein [Streptomyces sp. NBC_00378]
MNWSKSSFSEASGNACVEVAAVEGTSVAIRESDSPGVVLITSQSALRALVLGIKHRDTRRVTT